MKKIKSPTEPVLLSAKSFKWLEDMLRANDSRRSLTKDEKELLAGSREFDKMIREMANG